jgi:hypothetical protein
VARGGATFGSFPNPVTVSEPGADTAEPALAVDASARVSVSWKRLAGAYPAVEAANSEGGDLFSAPKQVSMPFQSTAEPRVGNYDYTSDAVVAWQQSRGGEKVIEVSGFDATPPGYGGVLVLGPEDGFAEFPFAAGDLWSGVASSGIDFGDGTSASGGFLRHRYCAGTYMATATATDKVGNTGAWSHTFEFKGSNAPTLGTVTTKPGDGTGSLRVEIPCPGVLALESDGLRDWSSEIAGAGEVVIPLVAAASLRTQLMGRGQVRGSAEVVFRPQGASPIRNPISFTLRKRGKLVYWQNCPAPRSVTRGYMLTHLVRCQRARKVVAGVLAKVIAGSGSPVVRSRGFRCRIDRPGSRSIACRRAGHRILSPAG